jgi:hypothetical protein
MDPKSLSKDEIARKVIELDDRLEALVASLDASEPAAHAGIYAEMTAIHDEIFALKAEARQRPGKA